MGKKQKLSRKSHFWELWIFHPKCRNLNPKLWKFEIWKWKHWVRQLIVFLEWRHVTAVSAAVNSKFFRFFCFIYLWIAIYNWNWFKKMICIALHQEGVSLRLKKIPFSWNFRLSCKFKTKKKKSPFQPSPHRRHNSQDYLQYCSVMDGK
jgi:hypothetical protein